MNRLFTITTAIALILAAAACSHKAVTDDDGFTQFEVRETLKSASADFRVVTGADTIYLSVYTSVIWPEQFGDSNLRPLQDSLLTRMYHVPLGTDIDDAIRGFVFNDTILGPDAQFTRVDDVPIEGPESYKIEYTGKLIELTERTVTYNIYTSAYLGGAHGNTSSYPFTYDLTNNRILTLDNMFRKGTDKELLDLLKAVLAEMEGCTVRELADKGYFIDDMHVSPLIYLSSGGVVFHYNPYDIAPYSRGDVDIEIDSYVLSPYLTPEADALIN